MVIKQRLLEIGALLLSLGVLLLCLFIGRGISMLMDGLLPGSIIGMLLLAGLLGLGWLKPAYVAPGANLLNKWLPLLFVPISVGLVEHLDVLWQNGLVLVLSLGISTLLVLLFAGRLWQAVE